MTNRAKFANAKSMLDQQQEKSGRRTRKVGREMVPVSRPSSGGGNQLRAANESVSLADRARADLANMEEAKIFSDRQLDVLGIVHPRSKHRAMVDAMRQLRTKLYSLSPDKNFSVLVSSVVPEGGGSFVSLNLAATIAFDKAKTSMMVEANLHAPILHKLMKLIGREDARGLLEYLDRPELGIEHIVSPSGVPRMRVVPMGSNDEICAEHFTSARYRQLMVDIQQRYDNRYVIVDGPAMSNSTDAQILSEICDYTVLVVPYGGVTPGVLDSVIDEIDERKLAGIVINNQPG
ncbi:MAG: CpsD/CapB family tyrosine-protein kinase [Granulosicoccus sp.]